MLSDRFAKHTACELVYFMTYHVCECVGSSGRDNNGRLDAENYMNIFTDYFRVEPAPKIIPDSTWRVQTFTNTAKSFTAINSDLSRSVFFIVSSGCSVLPDCGIRVWFGLSLSVISFFWSKSLGVKRGICWHHEPQSLLVPSLWWTLWLLTKWKQLHLSMSIPSEDMSQNVFDLSVSLIFDLEKS